MKKICKTHNYEVFFATVLLSLITNCSKVRSFMVCICGRVFSLWIRHTFKATNWIVCTYIQRSSRHFIKYNITFYIIVLVQFCRNISVTFFTSTIKSTDGMDIAEKVMKRRGEAFFPVHPDICAARTSCQSYIKDARATCGRGKQRSVSVFNTDLPAYLSSSRQNFKVV